MKVDVVMPKMGESIQEGKILQWLKKEGDKVERDEILLEISTDKVDTEVPSPSAGILAKIAVGEGDTVEVGTVIAQIETDVNAAARSFAPEQPAAQPAPQAAAAPEPAPAPEPVAAQPEAAPAPQEAPQPAAQAETASADSGATVDVVMPKMGESIQEGKVLQWLKKEGDKVERDEILLEISTDKVDTEVPSPAAGTLVKILVGEGDTVEVGTVIAKIGSGSAAPAAKPAAPAPQPAKEAPAAAPAPQPAPAAQQAAPHTNGTTPKPAAAAVAVTGTTPARRTSGSRFYSPLVRTIASDKNVSLEELDAIEGSGLEGRVTKNDLMSYLENRTSGKSTPAPQPAAKEAPAAAPAPAAVPAEKAPAPAAAKAPAAAVKPSLSKEQLEAKFGDRADIVPMDHIRTLIAEHMVMSKHTSPHVTSVAEADVTGIVRARDKFKNEFQKREGIKLTFTPFIAAAVVEAVRRFMNVNVSVDGKFIIKHKRINLGVATALDDGNLIVPVIKSADALNITGLGRAVNDLSLRARSKKLSPDEIQGGTVTLTNVGTFGTLFGTPVINQPQVAIFGVGAIKKRAVVKEVEGNDLIVVRHMVYMSITYDHRVVDGMLAGQCLAAVCESLESMNENTVRL